KTQIPRVNFFQWSFFKGLIFLKTRNNTSLCIGLFGFHYCLQTISCIPSYVDKNKSPQLELLSSSPLFKYAPAGTRTRVIWLEAKDSATKLPVHGNKENRDL